METLSLLPSAVLYLYRDARIFNSERPTSPSGAFGIVGRSRLSEGLRSVAIVGATDRFFCLETQRCQCKAQSLSVRFAIILRERRMLRSVRQSRAVNVAKPSAKCEGRRGLGEDTRRHTQFYLGRSPGGL